MSALTTTADAPNWNPVTTFERSLDGRTVATAARPSTSARGGVVVMTTYGRSYTVMSAQDARELGAGLIAAAEVAETRWPEAVWPDPTA